MCPVKLLIVPLYSGHPGYSEPGVVVPGRWPGGPGLWALALCSEPYHFSCVCLAKRSEMWLERTRTVVRSCKMVLKVAQQTGYRLWRQTALGSNPDTALGGFVFLGKMSLICLTCKTKIITWQGHWDDCMRYCMHKSGLTAYYLGVHDLIAVLLMWWTHCYNYLTKKSCALPLVIVSMTPLWWLQSMGYFENEMTQHPWVTSGPKPTQWLLWRGLSLHFYLWF